MLSRMRDPLDARERLERVRRYLSALGLRKYRAIVFGSVARGDFTAESDTDVLVVSDDLPQDRRERLDKLFRPLPGMPEIEPIGWTWAEWDARVATHDSFIAILEAEGVVCHEDSKL